MKKRIIIVLGILIAAGGIGTGVWYHFKGNGQSGTGDSIVYVSKVSVITGSETTAVNRFAGVVEPQKTVNVKIESGRKVKEVEVKTGQLIFGLCFFLLRFQRSYLFCQADLFIF